LIVSSAPAWVLSSFVWLLALALALSVLHRFIQITFRTWN